jgi:hypothetical protein
MAVLMFPDNTVLINFAIINRMDLLERLANGNGRWCATVAIECAESAKRPELAASSFPTTAALHAWPRKTASRSLAPGTC